MHETKRIQEIEPNNKACQTSADDGDAKKNDSFINKDPHIHHVQHRTKNQPQISEHPASLTAAAQRLARAGINPKSVGELADVPLEAVEHVIAYAHTQGIAEEYVNGNIVNLLRAYRLNSQLPALSYKGRLRLEREQQERCQIDQDGVPSAPRDGDICGVPEPLPEADSTPPLDATLLEAVPEAAEDVPEAAENVPTEPDQALDLAAALMQHLAGALPRTVLPVVNALRIRVEASVIVLECSSNAHKSEVERRVLGSTRAFLSELPIPHEVRVVVRPPVPSTAPPEAAMVRPAWIAASHWQTLPAMLRAALEGSELTDGMVHASTTFRQRALDTRYTRELGELCALAQEVMPVRASDILPSALNEPEQRE